MASDEKILQFKDLKTYNNRVKQYVDENAGSGGGSTTLADLGITVSAAQINEIPSIKSKATGAYDNEEAYRVMCQVNSVTVPGGSVNANYTTSFSTGISSYMYIRSGYIKGIAAAVSYYISDSYWYAQIQFHNSGISPFDSTCELITYYNNYL